MKIFTKAQEAQLIKNAQAGESRGRKPVVKLFGGGACTWLISEKFEDGALFGLCDLGKGFPELGYVSQASLEAMRFAPFGLPIERDLHFTATKSLVDYADDARETGSINA
jgi:hypothetical protein